MLFSDCVLAPPINDNDTIASKPNNNMSDYDIDVGSSLLSKEQENYPTATNTTSSSSTRAQQQQQQHEQEEITTSLKHKVKLLSSRAMYGDIIKEDEEEDMPLTLLGNTNTNNSNNINTVGNSNNLGDYPSTTPTSSVAVGSLLDFVSDDQQLSCSRRSLMSINDDNEDEYEEEEYPSKVMGILPRESTTNELNDTNESSTIVPPGGFFSTVSTESPFLKDGSSILPKPDQHVNFTRQQELDKQRRQHNDGLRKAFENTWKFTQGAASAVGRTTTNVLQGTVDFLLEPIPEEMGYRNVTHGEQDMYDINKFTVFEEKLDRFLDDVLDGPEGEGNLGWYRRVQLNQEDDDDEIHSVPFPSGTQLSTTTTSFSDSKVSSTSTSITAKSTISNEKNNEKQREASNQNRDLHDEVHTLKIELQRSKAEKEALEDELLTCYEQKENLRTLCRQLRERDVDLLQINHNHNQQQQKQIPQVEETGEQEEQEKMQSSVTTKTHNVIHKKDKEEDTWEKKVNLWKKLLKGIEMDMIIASKKKACNKQMHLTFIKEVQVHFEQFHKLISKYYFSASDNADAKATFIKKEEPQKKTVERSSVASKLKQVSLSQGRSSSELDGNSNIAYNMPISTPKTNEKNNNNLLIDTNTTATSTTNTNVEQQQQVTHDEKEGLFTRATTNFDELFIPPVPNVPPPPPPDEDEEDNDSPVIVQFDTSNLFGGTAYVGIDLIGLEDTTYTSSNLPTTTLLGGINVAPSTSIQQQIIPPDLFTESIDTVSQPYNTTEVAMGRIVPFPEVENANLVDFNYDPDPDDQHKSINNTIAADFMDLVPSCPDAPPPPPPVKMWLKQSQKEEGKESSIEEEEKETKKEEGKLDENNKNKSRRWMWLTPAPALMQHEKEEGKETSTKEEEEEGNTDEKKEDNNNKNSNNQNNPFLRFFSRRNLKEKEEKITLEEEINIVPEDPNKECMYTEIYSYLYDRTKPITLVNTNSLSQQNEENCDNSRSLINKNHKLSSDSIMRYSRQLLLQDGFGITGQEKLGQAKVLVVGAGGIGSTAASGIGNISIVDSDTVEMSNLHRQVIHTQDRIGMNKAASARQALLSLNPTIHVTDIPTSFSHLNAIELCSTHDIVVDATDNPRTRYMINDACVISSSSKTNDNNNKKTSLVSGSAMGTEGQVSVYNYGENAGCYRCLYPNVDGREGCKSCSDNGVLGPVPGIIGLLQSLEVIKIITGVGEVLDQKLLMFDSLACSFYKIKKPKPLPTCELCSDDPIITSMLQSFLTLKSARGPSSLPCANSTIPSEHNVSCRDYYDQCIRTKRPHVLLDVRVKKQFDMCHLPNSRNIPLEELQNIDSLDDIFKEDNDDDGDNSIIKTIRPIYCICRRGIASVDAVHMLLDMNTNDQNFIYNIDGGLSAWTEEVDPSFPKY